jgi:hypothetical protein
MIMPNVAKHFDMYPANALSEQNMSNVEAWMKHVYYKRITARSNISQLIRCCLLYGRPVLKTSVKVYNNKVWPTQRVVDPFAFYVYPETSANIEDAELIFEDYLFSYAQYKALSDKYSWLEPLSAYELTKPEWPYHLTERLAYQGITDPTQNVANLIDRTSDALSKTSIAFVSLTEMWRKIEDKWFQIFIAWNVDKRAKIVGFIKSDYDEPLYRTAVHRPLPGEMYTNEQFADITGLDILQNHQLNSFQEAIDWEQGIVATSSNQRKQNWEMKGRAVWETEDDPRQTLQFLQPTTTSTNQLRAWQIYLGLMNSMGGAGTIAEGQPGRNMPRAGFAMNTLVELGMADIQDIAKLIEEEILTRALGDIFYVARFIPDDQLMVIPGAEVAYNNQPSAIMKKEHLIGDYEFTWIGSIQYQDENLRAQRVMIFLNMLSNPQMMQLLAQQGYQVNMAEMVQMTWRYILGERGLRKILQPIPQQPIAQPGQSVSSNGNANGAANSQSRPSGNSNGTPGLQYTMPSLTSGFIQQR